MMQFMFRMPSARWPLELRLCAVGLAVAGVPALIEPLLCTAQGCPGTPWDWLGALASGLGINFASMAGMLSVQIFFQARLPASGLPRRLGLAALVLAMSLAGLAAHAWACGSTCGEQLWPPQVSPYAVQQGATVALLFVLGLDFVRRHREAADALHRTRLQAVQLERDLADAHLHLLQAQVEPHFLFNTLATLRRLVRTEPPAARAMLADLLRYLEEALPRLREERSTLAREVSLVRAYLAVHQVRMGPRLTTAFAVPAELGGCAVPTMALLTLVENALKHGIAPLVQGGEIRLSAQATQGRLTVVVADTGRGLVAGGGHGSGLANLSLRLKAMHGERAVLSLRSNPPQGALATLILPLSTS